MRLSAPPLCSLGNLALFLSALRLLPEVRAITFASAPSPALDISDLGRVALAGNFDSISLYKYLGQDEDGLHTNGSESILARYPDGGFATVASADSYISTMCPFVRDGKLEGIVVGGNFTGVGQQQAQAAILFDPNSGAITPLPGLNGAVNSVYCDSEGGTVYFGGSFSGGNSTNAIAWTDNWTNLPFNGFNGPVTSIARLSNGHFVFGGSFTGIGNLTAPTTPNAQSVNVGSANISAGPNTSTHQTYSDPRNVICKTNGEGGNGWLLQDNAPGFWRADFGFYYNPTKLRLLNSQLPGYGVKTWRLTSFPSNGIMNLTYFNTSGQQYCTADCPLMQGNSSYQDFYFINTVGMDGWRIDVSDWYGNGGGLDGIELFQNDIYSFAIGQYNEPQCDSVSYGSNSTATGPWNTSPSGLSNSQYLTSYLASGSNTSSNLSVVFQPDIKQSGNYYITVYTPGCLADNTCSTRGSVNITGLMGAPSSTQPIQPISTTVSQTNDYDKYDQVYFGFIDASTSSSRPSVTLTPSSGQGGPLTVVAQRVRFELRSSTGGLNGLFEYDPSQATIDTDFSKSAVDSAGNRLNPGARITALTVINNVTYAGGNFTSDSANASHIMAIADGNLTTLPGGGLNEAVEAMYNPDTSILYVGGNFTSTRDNATDNLHNMAAYSIVDKSWQAIGAGVNGPVWSIVPIAINVSSSQQESAIAFSGYFDQILPFSQNPSVLVENLAVWVPSQNNWLQNLPDASIALSGRINTFTTVPDMDPIFAGTVDSQTLSVSGIVGLESTAGIGLQQMPVKIQPQPQQGSSLQKRANSDSPSSVQGVATGLYYGQNNLNLTILGGHFQATASNGSTLQNLVIINNTENGNQITGLSPAGGNASSEDAILALDTHGMTLYAGGAITSGLVSYDLIQASLTPTQPPPLNGGSAVVQDIAARPSSAEVYFSGSFTQAGSLACPALCSYDTGMQQWKLPATGLSSSSVINRMTWASATRLILAGNMSINGNYTTMASYDAKASSWTRFQGSDDPASVPGPISVFSASDDTYNSFFAAGTAANGSAFISKFTSSSSSPSGEVGGSWASALSPSQFGPATVIQGLQMLSLSSKHTQTPLVDQSMTLLVTGLLELNGFGNASAALFNGTVFEPFALSTLQNGAPGSLRRAFVQNPQNLLSSKSTHHLAVGFIVLIALAIALALIFLIVIAGILAERYRRRREGYVPAPTGSPSLEKSGGNTGAAGAGTGNGNGNTRGGTSVGGIPAERLFGNLGNGGGAGNSRGGSML